MFDSKKMSLVFQVLQRLFLFEATLVFHKELADAMRLKNNFIKMRYSFTKQTYKISVMYFWQKCYR